MTKDEKADFEALFLNTRAPLLGYLDRRVPPEDAVDLLAEVYLTAWRKRSALPRGEERRVWLFAVARRLVAEHHRSTANRSGAAGATHTGGEPERDCLDDPRPVTSPERHGCAITDSCSSPPSPRKCEPVQTPSAAALP